MKNIYTLALLLLSSFSSFTQSQKIFSEGIIKFDVYVNGSTTPSGVYIVTVKGGNIRREISMFNGYHNTTLYSQKTGITFSLNDKDDAKYALQISAEELKEKNKKYMGAKFSSLNDKKKVAGYNCIGNNVIYTNGENANFYYTPELNYQFESFNAMFPGLQGIPLEYVVSSTHNLTMKFVATQVESKAIDTDIFELPSGYRIVTSKELESLK